MYDRRNHQRINTKFLVNCSKRNSQTLQQERFLAYSKNISSNGIHLVVSKRLQDGERLNMSLELPDFFLPVSASGEVMWNQESFDFNNSGKPNKIYEIGVRFNYIDLKDQEKLKNFLDKRLNQKVPA